MSHAPRKPYLIQRAKFKPYNGYPRISEALDLDYMGSAEFEFGALPKSLRALEAVKDKLVVLDVLDIYTPNRSRRIPLKVLSPWSEESAEWETYKGYLRDLRENKIQTKERTDFAANPERSRADFWWDIGNHVMFSFRQHFAHDILHLLDSSWKYMNEKAEERNARNNLIAGTSQS